MKIMASGPITSWQTDGEIMETVKDFIFLDSQITADGDCSHEIKKRLILGRITMTNLDSILKNRDITLPTKVCIVIAMVFPIVMYGCESWTIKKSAKELMLFLTPTVVLVKTLESPLASKEIKAVDPKETNSAYSLEGLMLKLKHQSFGPLMRRANSLKKMLILEKIEGGRRRGWQRMKLLDSSTNSTDMNLSKLQETVEDGGAWRAAAHVVAKSWT